MERYGQPSFIGMKRMALMRKNLNVSAIWTSPMNKNEKTTPQFAICINNSGYPASLELHKIYRVLPDDEAAEDGDLRVIDESGEDYLYSADYFIVMKVPQNVERALLQTL